MLDLPGVVEVSRDTDGEFCLFEAKSASPVAASCRLSCKLLKNGTKVREINDVPHLGKPSLIRYRVQRFSCADCIDADGVVVGSGGIYERLPFLQDGFLMTKRLLVWMARQAMRRTFAEVSRDAYVDPKTAAKAFNAYVDVEIKKLKRETPRVLGIDEKKLLGEFRAVLGNLEQRTVLDMLVDREASLELLLNRLSSDSRLEVVVTDRYDGYRKMIQRRLPGRLHVTDRFHVTRHANEVLDKIRGTTAKRLPDRREGAGLRMARQLFRRRWVEASDLERETIERWCTKVPVLRDAYWAKERYCDLYLCGSPAEAEAYYKNWTRTLPETVAGPFLAGCTIPRRWMPMLLAYFEEPYTTGYVESVNRFLDDLQRDGRGYSFEVIRAKLMLAEKLEKRVFRGRNRVTGPRHGLPDAGRTTARWGADLDSLLGLYDPPQMIVGWDGTERPIANGLSTLWPRFLVDADAA